MTFCIQSSRACTRCWKPRDGGEKVLVKASDPDNQNIEFDLDQHPGLKQAYSSRRLLFIPDARPLGIIAIPMIAQESVLGLTEVRTAKLPILTQANARFLK
jgi:hypothetical protein